MQTRLTPPSLVALIRTLTIHKIPLLLILCALIVVLRRPDLFYHPQFWAEDGSRWYKAAYENPLTSLFQPYAGSLQLLLRMGALLAVFFPLYLGPLIFVLVALTIQLLPVILIHTKRFRPMFKNSWFLWSITVFYLVQPNTLEVQTNLTNAGWHLAIAGLLILIGPGPRTQLQKILDYIILFVTALTGPFGLFLAPVALINYLLDKDNQHNRNKLAVTVICCVIQLFILAHAPSPVTVSHSLPFTHKSLLASIVGSQLVGTTVLGRGIVGRSPLNHTVSILLFAWFVLTTIVVFIRGSKEIRLCSMFGLIVLSASIFRAQDGNLLGLWGNFLSGLGGRYFYLPSLMWVAGLLWLLGQNSHLLRVLLLATILSSVLVAIPIDLKYASERDTDFYRFSEKFSNSEKGATLCHEIIPKTPDHAWRLCLKKH